MMSSLKSHLIYFVLKRRLARFRALELPLPQIRALRDEESASRFKLPDGVVAEPARLAGLAGEWLQTAGKPDSGVVLYLHGGAYVQGSVKTHRALAARLALASASSTFIVDYRLAPEHPHPAALDDALAVYLALRALAPDGSIALAGDSAGGGLAVALALRLKAEGHACPAALVLLSPWTDLTLANATHRTRACVDPYFPTTALLGGAATAYSGGRDLADPLISPQFADLGGLPPTVIHVGEREALLDDSLVLAAKMREQGTPVELAVYPGMWHVWQVFGGQMKEADDSLGKLGAFLQARLCDPRATA